MLSLALLTSTLTGALAADKERLAGLDQLDRPPERVGTSMVEIPEALRKSATDDTVEMIAIISTEGRVARVEQVKSATPEGAAAATAAVKKWVFARAFSKGEPVSFALPVTLAIRPGQAGDAAADAGGAAAAAGPSIMSTAEPRFEQIPEYPAALSASPVDGYAVASLLVDEAGRPGDVVIEFASRTEFAAPAAAILLTWIFEPARAGEKPIATRTSARVAFTVASAAWSAAERDLHARLRYLRDYDEGPGEKATMAVVFPYDALMSEKGGGVTLNVVIGPDGRVAHIVPEPGSDQDYVGAARASLACWEFFPATRADQPVFGQIRMQLTFDPRRDEFDHDDATLELIAALRAGTAEVFNLKNVDTHPRPTKQVVPRFPADHEGPVSGDAVIECVIDTQGRPRLPRIVRASTPEFGWAAATAVTQWRFEPAIKGGEPVASRARLPIRVVPDTTPAPAAP